MKEAIWGYAIIVFGIFAIAVIWFFANTTKTDQHNYILLKETVEAAMLDAVDLAAYRSCETEGMTREEFENVGCIKIEEEKFVENFIRRFAESAELSNTYVIEIYDINEAPPKVSLKVSSVNKENFSQNHYTENKIVEFDIVNNIDAILETKY